MSHPQERVLFFSPYARWNYHTALEITWAHALRLRGADTKFVLCNEILPVCDIHRANLNPRTEKSCLECQAQNATLFTQMGMPYEWMGDYLPREVRAKARDDMPHLILFEYGTGVSTASMNPGGI